MEEGVPQGAVPSLGFVCSSVGGERKGSWGYLGSSVPWLHLNFNLGT